MKVTWPLLVPIVASAIMWVAGARLGRRLPPATAVRLLTISMLVTSIATGFVLTVAAFTELAELPLVGAVGRWSVAVIRSGDAIPPSAGAAAGVTVVMLLAAAIHRALTSARDLLRSALVCRQLGPAVGGLVVVADDTPDAYALPGFSGRIVVSTAMLQALPANERAVLLAHEAAHLTHRHHAYLLVAELAAAANPLLRPSAQVVRQAVERWADEVAAAEVGDRTLAARALARAGVARTPVHRQGHTIALSAGDTLVADRARALLAGPPAPRPVLTAALAVLTLLVISAVTVTARNTETEFETAQTAYTASPSR
jgi:Zn-dependent protease with chaperone function